MCKTNFRHILVFRDLKNNVCAPPLASVFNKARVAVQHVPNDFLAGNEFCDFLLGKVQIFVTVREFGAECVGVALNLYPPPSANILDGVKDFCKAESLRIRERHVILARKTLGHRSPNVM